MAGRKSGFRTVDVARRAGYSVQQIRDLESDGVLPPVPRSRSGYRNYAEKHVQAVLAYRAFAAGIGPVDAKTMMRAAHRSPESELFALLDEAHARLHIERRDLALARTAAEAITTEPIAEPHASDSMSISELADALGVRTSTLRHWDAEGLVIPQRALGTGVRNYGPSDVRDARIVRSSRRRAAATATGEQRHHRHDRALRAPEPGREAGRRAHARYAEPRQGHIRGT